MMNFWSYEHSRQFTYLSSNSNRAGCSWVMYFFILVCLMGLVIDTDGVFILVGVFFAIAHSEKDSFCVRPNPRSIMPISFEKKVLYSYLSVALTSIIVAIIVAVLSSLIIILVTSFADYKQMLQIAKLDYYIYIIIAIQLFAMLSNFIRRDFYRYIFFAIVTIFIGFSNFLARKILGLKLNIHTLTHEEITSLDNPDIASFPALIFLGIATLISVIFIALIIKKAKTKPKATGF